MSNKYWLIEGYNSNEKFFEGKYKVGYFSTNKLQLLLMTLSAKAGLDYEEIAATYAHKNAKIANDLLKVSRDGSYPVFSCGHNPYFTARIITED